MASPHLDTETAAIVSTLFKRFLAYSKTHSPQERDLLEKEILKLFDLLGAASGHAIVEARTMFEELRSRPDNPVRVTKASDYARNFASTRIRIFESDPSNPRLSGPAREMLRIPLSEATSRLGELDQEQAGESLDRLFKYLRHPPTSEIEGDANHRTSIAVIKAYAKNFCNIPPFCSGKPQ